MRKPVGVWLPTIRAGTGVDRFTEALVEALNKRGIRAEISWLPHRAEYVPWSVQVPQCPDWVTVVHVNSWLHKRFIPDGLPLVVTFHSCVHDRALSQYKSLLQSIYHRWWVFRREKDALKRADRVTAVSNYTAFIAKRAFDIKDVTPIPNWVDTELYSPTKRTVPRKNFRLVFVGNLSFRKGADLLPEIMQRLGAEFELLYTGSGKWYQDVADLPSNMHGVGRLGNSAEIVSFYQNADALLFPTRLEGLPLTVLEAMAVGLPVVCSNSSSLPEVVIDGKTGIVCKENDVGGFVDGIMKLASDQQLYQDMSDASIGRVRALFGENRAIEEYAKIYQCLTLK